MSKQRALSRRDFMKLSGMATVGAFMTGGAGMVYSTQIELWQVEINPVQLTLPNLAPEFNGFRLVHISDIHFDNITMTRTHLDSIIEKIATLKPDAIAITGDFVTEHASRYEADLFSAMQKIQAIAPTFSVLGNHDHWVNPELLRRLFHETQITELKNTAFVFERNQAYLTLSGVDDYMERQDRLDLVLKHLPDKGAAILLAHEPDFADESAPTQRFDLQLSGHSHGGQVVLPFIGPPITPPLAHRYPKGLYRVGKMFQYTNRGLGTIPPRLRFNCPPEITLFTLNSP